MRRLLFILTVLVLPRDQQASQWTSSSPQDGAAVYACVDGNVTLPWQYILSSGDVLGDREWFYNGQSQELIAVSTHGQFVPLPAFIHRVQPVDNAGISVSHLAVADSGNYSVELHVYDISGVHTVLRRSVFVQINDHLMTEGGHLQGTQRSEPVLDTTTDQWAIQLQCGTFTFSGDPPYQVEWIIPSGAVVNSSNYNDNHFNLLLTNPVQGGNYTCHIPPQHADDACFHGNGTDHEQASIYVDKMDARFSLLEKKNEQLQVQLKNSDSDITLLKHQLTQADFGISLLQQQLTQADLANAQAQNLLKHENDQLKEQMTHMVSEISLLKQENARHNQSYFNLSQQIDHEQIQLINLQRQLQKLEQVKVADLEKSVNGFEDRARLQIGFHAAGLHSETPPSNAPLIVDNVFYNHGNAYNGTTGYFTAPLPGVYFFIATTECTQANSQFWLYVDVTGLSYVHSSDRFDVATVHAVVHLSTGQSVWMKSLGNSDNPGLTTFNGFLVSADP